MVPDEREHVVFIHFVVMIQGGCMLKLHKTGSKRVKGILHAFMLEASSASMKKVKYCDHQLFKRAESNLLVVA